jgi:hypothetical protein
MILAAIVLIAQTAASPPNPCQDQLSALCRISPLFCPSAYPSNLVPGTNGVPCWPERSVQPLAKQSPIHRDTRPVGTREPEVRGTTTVSGATQLQSAPQRRSLAERLEERLRSIAPF